MHAAHSADGPGKPVAVARGADVPLANLHLTILNKVGIKQASFGNSTGLISEV